MSMQKIYTEFSKMKDKHSSNKMKNEVINLFCCFNQFRCLLYLNNGLFLASIISNTSDSVSSGYPNSEKRVENTTRREFLTNLEVFG